MPNPKTTFIQNLQSNMSDLAVAVANLIKLYSVYFDRGYNSGGSNELIDSEIDYIAASDVANAITFIENLEKLLNNQDPTNGDYDITVNIVRNDF